MNKSVVYKDIEIAKQMIEDKTNNLSLLKCPYSDSSPIYRFSNEHIDSYKKYLEKKKKNINDNSIGRSNIK